MLFAVAAYVVALISGRAFVIDWPLVPDRSAAWGDLFEYPSPEVGALIEDVQADFGDALSAHRCKRLLFNTFEDTKYHIAPVCVNFSQYEEYQCWNMESFHYFLPALRHNPIYKDLMASWFEPHQAIPLLFPLIFQPKPEILARVEAFKKVHWSEYTIALHLRRLEKPDSPEKIYWDCAKDLVRTRVGDRNVSTTFFISTESACTKLHARQILGCSAVFSENPYDRRTPAGIADGLIDMYLIGEADDVVLTGVSTFSDAAAARTNIVPHVMVRSVSMCVRLLSSEPPMSDFRRMLRGPCATCVDPAQIEELREAEE